MLICRFRFSRDFAYREIGVFVALCSLHYEISIPETPMRSPVYKWMVPISAWFNNCDQIVKSHIAISGFLMSSELDISKSRSLNLRWSLLAATHPYEWMVQTSYQEIADRDSNIQEFHVHGNSDFSMSWPPTLLRMSDACPYGDHCTVGLNLCTTLTNRTTVGFSS